MQFLLEKAPPTVPTTKLFLIELFQVFNCRSFSLESPDARRNFIGLKQPFAVGVVVVDRVAVDIGDVVDGITGVVGDFVVDGVAVDGVAVVVVDGVAVVVADGVAVVVDGVAVVVADGVAVVVVDGVVAYEAGVGNRWRAKIKMRVEIKATNNLLYLTFSYF